MNYLIEPYFLLRYLSLSTRSTGCFKHGKGASITKFSYRCIFEEAIATQACRSPRSVHSVACSCVYKRSSHLLRYYCLCNRAPPTWTTMADHLNDSFPKVLQLGVNGGIIV